MATIVELPQGVFTIVPCGSVAVPCGGTMPAFAIVAYVQWWWYNYKVPPQGSTITRWWYTLW